jgi:hypothetical protein
VCNGKRRRHSEREKDEMFHRNSSSANTEDQVASGTPVGGRRAGRLTRLGLAGAVTVAAILSGASPAAAASFDPRIAGEQQVTCLGNTYGLTPSVRVIQPWVVGNSANWETIKWMPYLQRWDSRAGWQNILRSSDWHRFSANRSGPSYLYYSQPQRHVFSNLVRGYYYRVIHVIQWTSTGELGSMPSDYHTTAGYCLL